jgi:hypothetical protein
MDSDDNDAARDAIDHYVDTGHSVMHADRAPASDAVGAEVARKRRRRS